ncbi:MAG: arylamine N-acetyltransferase [Acidobacteria bacterium]|nr:arylamine N-acetyltransferase [Acidobacteriota bacterium]
MVFDLAIYLKRIGLGSEPSLDLAGLTQLHNAQFKAIPFENLDIQLGRSIQLDPESLWRKLVLQRRGGYCFELNGLLLLALRALGFEARPFLARVHLEDPPSGRTHQLNAVNLDAETLLVDAGFGAGGPRFPMLLADGWQRKEGHFGFRIRRQDPYGWLMQSWTGEWKDSYSFDEGWVTPQDIEVANFFTSHSPMSHFTQMRTVSRPLDTGRISLRNQTFTEIQGDQQDVREIPDSETLDLLRTRFAIDLDTPFAAFKPIQSD